MQDEPVQCLTEVMVGSQGKAHKTLSATSHLLKSSKFSTLLVPEMLPNKTQDTPLLFLFFIYCSVRDTGEVRHLTRV